MSDAIPITIRYSLKLDVKAIIQHKRDLDPLLPLKNFKVHFTTLFFWMAANSDALITSLKMRENNEEVNDFVSDEYYAARAKFESPLANRVKGGDSFL